MSTLQEYWDYCLIRAWRNHLQVLDAMKMFYSITGKRVDECELLRLPKSGMPWTTNARMFTAYYLPKVNDWLWDKPPEKDIDLFRKLSKSKYNTGKTPYRTNADRDLANEQARNRRNKQVVELSLTKAINKNSATDWNVTKGSAKIRVRK